MIKLLEEIDELLTFLENTAHGEEGKRITEMRYKILTELSNSHKQVVASEGREKLLSSFLTETSFKNVSGNWQFKGDITPERVFEILMQLNTKKMKQFTVLENDERVDFNKHSFKEIEGMVYQCAPCGCYHVKVTCKEQYQDHIYKIFSENTKLGEMNHLDKYYE